MKKKVFSVLLTVALATGVLAGCGSSAATGNNAATGAAQNEGSQTASATTAGEESGDTIVIRSCFATGMTGAVNRFAIEKGLYKELGIEFENVEASADTNSTVMSLITRGEIDVADGDPSSYIPGIYNGVPAKLVGNMWRYSGCYWLVANNDIQDFSDLEGKKVGVLKLRVFRPFPSEEIAKALANCKAVAVMDRCESYNGNGGPLGSEVPAALFKNKVMIEAVNYIYGLAGRDFTIKDVKDVFAELEDMIENGKTVEQYQYIRLRG